MRICETLLDGNPELYEQRFTLKFVGLRFPYVRRPIAIVPPEGIACFVDEGPRIGSIPRHDWAVFTDGEWRRTKLKPTHWTALDD